MVTHLNELKETIDEFALQHGALLVGYTTIRRIEPVIIIGYPFPDRWFMNHPFYVTKRFGEELLASRENHKFIRKTLEKAGYQTQEKTPLSVYGDFRPLAVSAGLGDWGRNGLVVNKDYGSKLLFSAIFTNAPLYNGINQTLSQEHCSDCGHCRKACPASAFAEGTFHISRCLPKAIRGCGECIRVCKGMG